MVIVNSIILGSNNADSLIIVHQEKFRLSQQWNVKDHQVLHDFCLKVKLHYFVLFCKKDTVYRQLVLSISEDKLHRDASKFLRPFSDNYPLNETELILVSRVQCSGSLENEELVGKLFIHD